jgi:hypothetical protein
MDAREKAAHAIWAPAFVATSKMLWDTIRDLARDTEETTRHEMFMRWANGV